jgi:mannitol-1-phosphate/altronate dehydrogenase
VNTIQVSDNQVVFIYFACLAVLHCPMTVEDKIQTLELALMTKVLESDQSIAVVQTGLEPFDNAINLYANKVQERFENFDLSKVSTGSVLMDAAFKLRVQKIIETNFPQAGS